MQLYRITPQTSEHVGGTSGLKKKAEYVFFLLLQIVHAEEC